MYALREDADAEPAADAELRAFLGQQADTVATAAPAAGCRTRPRENVQQKAEAPAPDALQPTSGVWWKRENGCW